MVKHRNELAELERAWRRSQPVGTRREMLKWSAIAAGAVATMGTGVAAAAPARPSGAGRTDQSEITRRLVTAQRAR